MKQITAKILIFLFFITALFGQSKTVLTGIDVLKENNFEQLKGLKIGLITNQTGVDKNLNSTIDLFHQSKNIDLVCLFGPEHGVRGDIDAGKKVQFYKDEKTGIPVYSLYGKTRKPTKEMLENIDALVYDIQDIGCRSYTFISTMGLAMEAAAENNKKFFVLDRPNPLGGNRIEGNLPEKDFISFISQYQIPYIYGLTCGELAAFLNNEGMLNSSKKCNLTVIKMKNWNRKMTFEDCGLLWVPTSPHIPNIKSTFYYPATGILGELRSEFNIGVGYTLPFEFILVKNIDSKLLEKTLKNKFDEDNVIFRGTSVIPYYTDHKGKNLKGVQIYLINNKIKDLISIQFCVLEEILSQRPDLISVFIKEDGQCKMFDKALGTDKIRNFIISGEFEKIKPYLNKDAESFRKVSEKHYLYN